MKWVLPALTLGFAAPVCRTGGRSVERRFSPCGTGPFRLASWEPSRAVHLARHEGYFLPGRPYVDAIHLDLAVPQLTQREAKRHGLPDGRARLRPRCLTHALKLPKAQQSLRRQIGRAHV